jgi:hypothetical protein
VVEGVSSPCEGHDPTEANAVTRANRTRRRSRRSRSSLPSGTAIHREHPVRHLGGAAVGVIANEGDAGRLAVAAQRRGMPLDFIPPAPITPLAGEFDQLVDRS